MWSGSGKASDRSERDREDARLKEREALSEQAKSRIPTVQEQQPARLIKFQAEHEADVKAFQLPLRAVGRFSVNFC